MIDLRIEVSCKGIEGLDVVSQKHLRAMALTCALAEEMRDLGCDLAEAQRRVAGALARAWSDE